MGSGEWMEIQTEIANYGEDAFNAVLQVQVPRGVSYVNANSTDAGVRLWCDAPSLANNYTVECKIGNPLKGKGTKVSWHPCSRKQEVGMGIGNRENG